MILERQIEISQQRKPMQKTVIVIQITAFNLKRITLVAIIPRAAL